MLNRIQKFSTKITIIITGLVGIAVLLITLFSFYSNRQIIKENQLRAVEIHNLNITHELDQIFKSYQSELKRISDKKRLFTIPFIQMNESADGTELNRNRFAELSSYFKNEIFYEMVESKEITNVYLINTSTQYTEPLIVFEYHQPPIINEVRRFKNIDNMGINTHVKTPNVNHPILESGKFYSYVSHPISIEDEVVGMVLIKLDISKIASRLNTTSKGLLSSGCVDEIVKLEKKDLFKIYSNEDSSVSVIKETEDALSEKMQQNWMKVDNYFSMEQYQNKRQINYWSYNPKLGVAIVTKYPFNNKDLNQNTMNYITLLIAVAIIGISFLLSLFFARMIVFPIIKLKQVLQLVSKGILPNKLDTPLKDELGDMIITSNEIVNSLKSTAIYAQKIGTGEFDYQFKPLSSHDTLGNALINMSKSLQKANSKDELRNWIIQGLAEIGSILREHDNMQSISEEVIQYLCFRVNALQGALYLYDESTKKLTLKSTFAYGKQKNRDQQFDLGEGLVGQCAIEKNIIIRNEIPENYLHITSGLLGDKQPSHLILVPLKYNDVVYGVVEMASFAYFESDVTEFLEEVGTILSRSIYNIQVNENTRKLLEQSQRMSKELTEKTAELERNAEKMALTQLEITDTNKKLQEQVNKVQEAQDRQYALLTNSDEIIFIMNISGLIQYASPSVGRILGYSELDLLDSRDEKRVSEVYRNTYNRFMNDIIASEKAEQFVIQYEYFKKSGETVWLEAVGTNQLENPAIQGIVINVRDITIRKQAEEEQRKRSQMQSLSENSTDLIMRVGLNKEVFYCNPTITTYTGLDVNNILNKQIQETLINQYVDNAYIKLLDEVKSKKEITELEADFKRGTEQKILSIKAIPEFDLQENLESVLIISHDVTEAKTNERIVQEKNKQIEDSIYYAENIQKAVLPDDEFLRNYMQNSFVFFRPRDIVSGDFPWMKEHNGYLYIAAVDCTGHGVPGAMTATVGYFLLQGILSNGFTPNAGEMLDKLDVLLTETFKQNDSNSKLRDGMDMVLCRIKLSDNSVDIASANRPIYLVREGSILEEIKGDKFPIGGGNIYKNKSNFTNNKLTFKNGENLFFFSDGLQDQFNEAENEKFGTKRIREWIDASKQLSFIEKEDSLNQNFKNWMGKGHQTDDILFIGIGF